MKIKITPVRERAHWTCEYKGTVFEEGRIKGRCLGLHCSHYEGRGNWSTRFDPMNCFAHSYGSHRLMEAKPALFNDWVLSQLGEYELNELEHRSNDTRLGREYRKANKGRGDKNALRTHFKKEFDRLRVMRSDGVQGRLSFCGFLEV